MIVSKVMELNTNQDKHIAKIEGSCPHHHILNLSRWLYYKIIPLRGILYSMKVEYRGLIWHDK